MKILGIESAAMTASAAIAEDGIVLCESTTNFKKTHSQTLLPMIREVTEASGTPIASVDVFAVSAGPGSFTGLRIGAATAKGLAYAVDRPIVAVPTLAAMAYGLWGSSFLLCPMMDARRSEVYAAFYEFDGDRFLCVSEAMNLPVKEVVLLAEAAADARGKKVLYLGDGARVYRALIESTSSETPVFAPAHVEGARAASVAALGKVMYEAGESVSAYEFEPIYLKKSQAEQEREAAGLSLLPEEKTAGLFEEHDAKIGKPEDGR